MGMLAMSYFVVANALREPCLQWECLLTTVIDGLMTVGRFDRPRGPAMDQQELQRIAQLVEMNRQKMARIEEQMTRLSEIRMEQLGVIASLKTLATRTTHDDPSGAGVQLPASPTGDTVVIDIGSGVQAEKPRVEAIEILKTASMKWTRSCRPCKMNLQILRK